MSSGLSFYFEERPQLFPVYARLFLLRRKGLRKGERLPQWAATWPSAKADAKQLSAYRKTCGFPGDGPLPILYPYILASNLQLSLMSQRLFPLPPMGTVHQRIHVTQYRPIAPDEAMHIECSIGDSRVAKRGLEFDVNMEVKVGGERVWECVGAYLSRGKYGEPEPESPLAQMPELENTDAETGWAVPKGIGRRYARITGDYNPIHVSSILAKVFGFKRAIAHGMWSAAMCYNNLEQPSGDAPVRYDVAFKGPVFMGRKVKLVSGPVEGGRRFDLFCGGNDRPVVKGMLRAQD